MDQYKAKAITGTTTPRVAEIRISLPHEAAPGITVVVEQVTALNDGRTIYEGLPALGDNGAAANLDTVLYELDPDSRQPTGNKMSVGEFLNWAASWGVTQYARSIDATTVDADLPLVDSTVEAKPLPAEATVAVDAAAAVPTKGK